MSIYLFIYKRTIQYFSKNKKFPDVCNSDWIGHFPYPHRIRNRFLFGLPIAHLSLSLSLVYRVSALVEKTLKRAWRKRQSRTISRACLYSHGCEVPLMLVPLMIALSLYFLFSTPGIASLSLCEFVQVNIYLYRGLSVIFHYVRVIKFLKAISNPCSFFFK